MRKYWYKFLGLLLVVGTCIVALFITSSKIGAQCIDISDIRQLHKFCPTPETVIDNWYGINPGVPTSPLKGLYAVLPFPTIPGIGNCLDINNKWCGCTGADCFNESANDHLKVQLLWNSNIPSSKRWKITFTPPIPSNDINLKGSSCFTNPSSNYCSGPGNSPWKNPSYKSSPLGGNLIDYIEFEMPPRGCVWLNNQICMWDFTIANKRYHEHFVTNEDCYGWIELMVLNQPPLVSP
jgi:hypothetical protein